MPLPATSLRAETGLSTAAVVLAVADLPCATVRRYLTAERRYPQNWVSRYRPRCARC
ncbi:hypothetical protein [Nocardia sp. NPDC003963]